MPKNVPSLKPGELLRILVAGGCSFLRQRALHNCIKPTILSSPRRRLCRNPHFVIAKRLSGVVAILTEQGVATPCSTRRAWDCFGRCTPSQRHCDTVSKTGIRYY